MWNSRFLKRRNAGSLAYFLDAIRPVRIIWRFEIEGKLTFGDSENGEKLDTAAVSTPHIVVNIADRHVDGPIVVLTCPSGDRRLVAPQDNGDEHGTTSSTVILRNCVLSHAKLNQKVTNRGQNAYRLSPGPIAGHEMFIPPCPVIFQKVAIGRIVDLSIEVWVGQDVGYERVRITEPKLINFIHPRGSPICRLFTGVLEFEGTPRDVS